MKKFNLKTFDYKGYTVQVFRPDDMEGIRIDILDLPNNKYVPLYFSHLGGFWLGINNAIRQLNHNRSDKQYHFFKENYRFKGE